MNKSLNGFPLAPSLGASAAADGSVLDATRVGTRGSAIAGEDIRKNDGVIVSSDGLAYPIEFVEYDATISGATPNVASGPAFNHHRQQQAFRPSNGDLYYVSNRVEGGSGPGGLQLNRATSWGANAIYKVVEAVTTTRAGDRMFLLASGNLCVVWQLAGGDLKFAIYDPDLVAVVAPTVIATPASDGFFDAVPLNGGGFAVCWLGAAGAQKLVIYSDAGAAVAAPATIQNWAGGADTSLGVKMEILSNDNIAIAFASRFAGSKGLYAGVWSPVGAQVVAPALLYAPAVQPVAFPEVAVLPGFFAVAQADTVNTKAFVLTNAGVVQGAAYSNTVGTGAAELTIKLVAGDGEFWLACQPSTNQFMLTALPTAGAGYAEFKVVNPWMTAVLPIDGFWRRGYFVCSQYRFGITFDTKNKRVARYFSTDTSTAAASHSLRPGPSFRALSVHDEPTQAILRLSYWMNFGIVGVASADAQKGEQAQFTMGPGMFAINPVRSSAGYSSVNFDFVSNGGGVKGTLNRSSLFIRSIS